MREAAQRIYSALREGGLSAAGAAAVLGNMQAESALRSDNAQDGMSPYSDKDYTARADAGEPDFASDAVGYGLCQWTYPTRKAALLRFARSRGKSLGDEAMQTEFCMRELREDYPGLWQYLCGDCNLSGAVALFCREFERPAVDNSAERLRYAEKWLELLKDCHCEEANNGTPAKGLTFCGERKKEAEDMELDTTGASGMYQASSDAADVAIRSPDSEYWPPRTIARGMSGEDVLIWQALMRARGYDCPAQGVFEEKTLEATLSFQKSRQLHADGIPGPITWREGLRI